MREIASWFLGCNATQYGSLIVELVELPTAQVISTITSWNLPKHVKNPLKHHSSIGGVAKFFLPEILYRHKKVIVYDTDVIVNRAVSELWKMFDDMNKNTLAATTKHEGERPKSVCSCLTLMNLERMRSAGWISGHPLLNNIFFNKKGFPDYPQGITFLGDQDLFSFVFLKHPIFVSWLPHTWVLSKCNNFYGVTDPKGVQGMNPPGGSMDWAALHYNCWSEKDELQSTQPARIYKYFMARVADPATNICGNIRHSNLHAGMCDSNVSTILGYHCVCYYGYECKGLNCRNGIYTNQKHSAVSNYIPTLCPDCKCRLKMLE